MEVGKRVQQVKVERGISFRVAKKAVLSEQSANTSSKRTTTSVVSLATRVKKDNINLHPNTTHLARGN